MNKIQAEDLKESNIEEKSKAVLQKNVEKYF